LMVGTKVDTLADWKVGTKADTLADSTD
jgi:hypothetical protein